MEITFQTKAWIGQYNPVTPDELRTEKGAASLHYTPLDMSQFGETLAGTATVTVTVLERSELLDNHITSLRAKAAAIRAQATAECTKIEGQIQQLLAIECSPAAVEGAAA